MSEKVNVSSIISKLKSLNLEDCSIEEIIELYKSMQGHGCVTVSLSKGTRICRTRFFEKLPDTIPVNVSDFSYNPKPPAYYGRANLVGESIFYGAISTEKLHDDVTSLFEVAKFDKTKITRHYYVTSSWILQRDIKAVLVGNNLFHAKESEQKRQDFIKSIKMDFESYNDEFDHFICEQFTNTVDEDRHFDYKLSSTYCSFLLNLGIDAVIYSSIQSGGAGTNVAISTSLVDDESILPDGALYGVLYNRYDDVIQEHTMHGKFDHRNLVGWTDIERPLHPAIKQYYTGKSDDKSFMKGVNFTDFNSPT